MKLVVAKVFVKEVSGLALAALTIAIGCGLLLQMFSLPSSVVLFAFSAGIVFGIFGGGFRRSPRVLEFLLTRNVTRRQYYSSRWLVCVVPLLISVALVAVNMFMPISGWFWRLFVESGFTADAAMSFGDGFGWFLFSIFGALWAYSATFALVSRTQNVSSMFVALLSSIVVIITVILMYMACASLLCSFGIIKEVRLYEPDSGIWLSFYVFSSILCFLSLVSGIRHFSKVDIA